MVWHASINMIPGRESISHLDNYRKIHPIGSSQVPLGGGYVGSRVATLRCDRSQGWGWHTETASGTTVVVGGPVSDLPLGFVGKELLDVKSTKHLVCFFLKNRYTPERKLVFQPSIFRCYVSFREGIFCCDK